MTTVPGGRGRAPVRTCLGCRQRKAQPEMWRFAVDNNGRVLKDFRGKHDGRHAYCCQDDGCLRKFFKNKKGLSRAFRQQVLGFDEGVQDLFGSEQ
ncbi:MAG: YlxR family protein [Desulfurivibrionaceae bacterium]|nr:YlxR family protein [Pseudomonadota bacterium]MBU4229441.1 YlxR family protein [Pseudomonadota bacterium]MBU4407496.1 YlxR family protein [Pseudomonadota bacterium]MBU4412374.1 YlxR family protein [Pseudomonadota bacterium]